MNHLRHTKVVIGMTKILKIRLNRMLIATIRRIGVKVTAETIITIVDMGRTMANIRAVQRNITVKNVNTKNITRVR